MEDYEYYYNYYRGKYYDACEEIGNCDQRIYSLQRQRTGISQSINSLNSKIRNMENALEKLDDVLDCEENISTKMTVVDNKTQQAAINYIGMVSSSDVTNKDLTAVFSDETSTTKSTISNVFATVRTKKSNLSADLTGLKAELKRAQEELESIDSQIRSQQSDRSYWKRQKNNSYYNMEYYRKRMMEVC